jgi:hypothetical protein
LEANGEKQIVLVPRYAATADESFIAAARPIIKASNEKIATTKPF